MTLRRTLRTVWLLWTFQFFASCLSAQTPIPPSSLKGKLLDLSARTNTKALGTPQLPDTDTSAAAGFDVLVGLEVSTAPFGTSTGSFTFTFDNQAGTFRRSTQSFGPVFGKRSLTIGARKLSVGFNWLHANYDSLAGLHSQERRLPAREERQDHRRQPVAAPLRLVGREAQHHFGHLRGFCEFWHSRIV